MKAQAEKAKNVVVIGASFIGLESASCIKDFLKEKSPNTNITVCDVASVPYERVLGTVKILPPPWIYFKI